MTRFSGGFTALLSRVQQFYKNLGDNSKFYAPEVDMKHDTIMFGATIAGVPAPGIGASLLLMILVFLTGNLLPTFRRSSHPTP